MKNSNKKASIMSEIPLGSSRWSWHHVVIRNAFCLWSFFHHPQSPVSLLKVYLKIQSGYLVSSRHIHISSRREKWVEQHKRAFHSQSSLRNVASGPLQQVPLTSHWWLWSWEPVLLGWCAALGRSSLNPLLQGWMLPRGRKLVSADALPSKFLWSQNPSDLI